MWIPPCSHGWSFFWCSFTTLFISFEGFTSHPNRVLHLGDTLAYPRACPANARPGSTSRMAQGEAKPSIWPRWSKPLWLIPCWLVGVGQHQWDPSLAGIGEFTTHRLPILVVGLKRMFTGGTIWILTHGHLASKRGPQEWKCRRAYSTSRSEPKFELGAPSCCPKPCLFSFKPEGVHQFESQAYPETASGYAP